MIDFYKNPVVYLCSRDQRVSYNKSLVYAQKIALENKQPLIVLFRLTFGIKNRNLTHYKFMLKGIEELEKNLSKLSIPFILIDNKDLFSFLNKLKATDIVCDFSPLKGAKLFTQNLKQNINSKVHIIDSHNIVPIEIASNKQEYSAFTLRQKLNKLKNDFFKEIPQPIKHELNINFQQYKNDWSKIYKNTETNIKNKFIQNIELKSGESFAKIHLKHFISEKLSNYNQDRNDPTLNATSKLSAYLHFGQISALEVVLNVNKTIFDQETKDAFIEEIFVRKELADNYCHYNKHYDSFIGIPNWAKLTLKDHAKDQRDYLYSYDQLEKAQTHDKAWNSAQTQMVKTGFMHSYMRMYWAKKILEWTPSPEIAIDYAIKLNDSYELDGHDPNGYVGILWSIGGLHDRAWKGRMVYGKIRYMNYNGLKRKFNVEKYITRYEN